MSGGPRPEFDTTGIIQQLGPGFDYTVIDRMAKAGMLDKLPKDAQEQLRRIQLVGMRTKLLAASEAPKDNIDRGAFRTPPPAPKGNSETYQDYLWSMLFNVPVVGQFAMMQRAWSEAGGNYTGKVPTEEAYNRALSRQMVLQNQWAQEFFHQFTVGIVPSPEVAESHRIAFNTIVKPTTAATAMGVQGGLVFRGLGLVSKVPKASTYLEQIPQRLRDIGAGATTMGVVDALRADGIPDDPTWLDPSGKLAGKMAELGVPERLALGVSGATVGGVLGGTILGIGRGIQWGREARFAMQATPEQIQAMKEGLLRIGVEVSPVSSNLGVVRQYVRNLQKVQNSEDLAGLTSEIISREEWVAQSIFSDAKIAQDSEEARYLSGLLRGQPGALSVATNIRYPDSIKSIAQKLGLKVDVVAVDRGATTIPKPKFEGHPYLDQLKARTDLTNWEKNKLAEKYMADVKATETTPVQVYDVLISRPDYQYQPFAEVSRQTKRVTVVAQQVAKAATKDLISKADNSLLVLADGSVVRGGFTVEELAKKVRIQAPVVDGTPRPDLGLKQIGQLINIAIEDGGKRLVVNLPHRLTQEQFNALGPVANVRRFENVVLITPDGKTVQMASPLGQQIQDAVTELVKPVKTASRITPDMVSQYKRTGVFKGQAAVLADGTPVTVQHKAGPFVQVTDPLTGQSLRAHPDRISMLPSSMEGELAPSNLFLSYLSPEEQAKFAKFRLGMLRDLGQPIKKFSELAQFANSRGFVATQKKGGGIQLSRMTDREPLEFKDMKSAITFIRKQSGPIPDMTPDDVKKVLGFTQPGFTLPQGTPPSFGELMPIKRDIVEKMLEANAGGRGPGANMIVPMRGLFLDLDKKYGTNFFPLFNNVKDRMRGRSNFEATWYLGQGSEKLPNGVLPLRKIKEMAGPDFNPEAITDYLEAGSDAARQAMVSSGAITPSEAAAARELRKWYNGLFTRFGIEADWVENYHPHIKEALKKYGTTDGRTINTYIQNDPLKPSRGSEFWADNLRQGALDMYDRDAFRVAMRYLQQGSANRFMKEPISQAAEVVAQLAKVNPHLATPMGYFLQAVRGTEFWEQRVALSETMQHLLDSLPGAVPSKTVTNVADLMVNYLQGSVYMATMGLRPSLAVRNIAGSLMMSWPLYGGNKGNYLEALSMALSKQGIDDAIADGAIVVGQGPRFAAEDITLGVNKMFGQMSDFGFRLYDTADEFTRASTYWAARKKAENALIEFGKKAPNSSQSRLGELKKTLILDSGIGIQDPQIVEEFLRRAATSPEQAARFAGVQASEMVNFLYGRGMQPRWMRSLTGRMVGQFGTWSMWYIDYIRRTTTNLARNGGRGAAASFLAKHAFLNMAIAWTGKEVLDLDMGRWMVYPSVFYAGGPGFEMAQGLSTLVSGLGPLSTEMEGMDQYTKTKIAMGTEMIRQSLPAMIPFYYAAQDAIKVLTARDPTVRLGALIAGRPTDEHTAQRKLEMLMGLYVPAFSSTSPVLDIISNSAVEGRPQSVPFDSADAIQRYAAPMTPTAGRSLPGTGPSPAPPPTVPPAQPSLLPVRVPSVAPSPAPGEAVNPAEARPIQRY